MNNKEVYINGILCDIDEGKSPIQLVYSINDLAELKDRQAYSTNTFKMPMTATNIAACGIPNDASLIQTQPYRRNTAKIVQNGIEVLTNGVALITKTDQDIEVQILSGLIGFFDRLGEKNIRDLDLSEYDHVWSLANVAGSQDNTEGYIYPVIDYGGLSETDRRCDVRQLRPAVFRKTILEKIISEAGYVASGSYASYEKYYNSLIPFANDNLKHSSGYEDILKGYNASARKTQPQGFNFGGNSIYQEVFFEDDASTDPHGLWDGRFYTASVKLKLRIVYTFTITQVWTQAFGSHEEVHNVVQLSSAGGAWINIGAFSTLSSKKYIQETFPDQLIDITININPGDRIRIAITKDVDTGFATIATGASVSFNPVYEEVVYGSDIQLSATLPDITQKNFFKEFLQNFGLIVIPDNYIESLLLINMEDVYANKPIADDISDRLINSSDDISYSLPGYGINNYGKYKDDDAVPDELGQGIMVFDNLTLADSVTLFTSVFAATVSVNKLGGLVVPQIKKIEDIAASADFKIKTQPRILLDRKINSPFEFYDGSASSLVNMVSIPTFDGLDYQSLFDENYPEVKRMLYRPFAATKKMLVKETDIANINWTIPVYDRKSASYYYKNKIAYIQGDISTISLIKLP